MNDYGSFRYLPADGWYAAYPSTDTGEERIFQRVALWRVAPHGTIVGLISLPDDGQGEIESQLLSAPRGQGVHYIHIDDLTEEERKQIRHRRFS
ncbi:hypothetical protein ABFO19_11985 [Xanthomonas citri pv. glycines]|uniref:Uncharacterized protein n=5 Tax=Xanthomonas TaxID=338 RepID=A0A1Y6HBF0_9XANT|nr:MULTISPECIES: hypothetical protein [Gammaproteobacteria]AOD15203.1 hypothetical protein BER92_11230 [Xanthomonas fragariae]AOD18605.1 hypothetical protein BER93_11255 [Xanthomonas fragariae]AOY62915.1 hypothetical protein BHE84_12625 [Xanthomonas citri pv. glycines str. 8ra]ATS51791.1 hypothetical protein XcfCFBP6992P_13505 [Xanthomonas citri pv. phaseoli var. fuscans]ATS80301.1 hypothetical protein XcfCFBP7767P_11315 [Xanthomonas citri pv. phaseoli var. fuscans]